MKPMAPDRMIVSVFATNSARGYRVARRFDFDLQRN
jgi:hypothetical protein